MRCAFKYCTNSKNENISSVNITFHRLSTEKIINFFGLQDCVPECDVLCQEHYLIFKKDYEEPSTSTSSINNSSTINSLFSKTLEMVPKSKETSQLEHMEIENTNKRKSNSISCEGPLQKKQSIYRNEDISDSESESDSDEFPQSYYESDIYEDCRHQENYSSLINDRLENNAEGSDDDEETGSINNDRILPHVPEHQHLPVVEINEIERPNLNISDGDFRDKLVDLLQRLPNLARFEAKIRIIQLVEEALDCQEKYDILSISDFERSSRRL